MMRRHDYLFYIGMLALLLAACSTTRNLPADEVLYIGIKDTEVVNKDKSDAGSTALEEVEAALACAPNHALMGSSSIRGPLPYTLWIYNKYVNSQSKFGRWMFDKFAATPVFISTVNPELRAKVATNVLHNYGYFRGKVDYEVLPDEKNPRKARVRYVVDMQQPYYIDTLVYEGFPAPADSLIQANRKEGLLLPGDNFNVTQLEAERNRIATLLRNNGYYYYRSNYITYLADTVQHRGHASLRMQPVAGLQAQVNRQYTVGDLRLNMYDNNRFRDFEHSITRPGISINYNGDKIPLRPGVLFNNFRFRRGELYSALKQQYTQENINSMGLFSSVEFQYTPRDTTGRNNVLDVDINTRFDKLLDGELEFDFKSKSNDQMGPGASFAVSKRNAFRGGETFSVQLDGSYEWQTGSSVEGNSAVINSYSYGISMAVDYPRLVIPFYRPRWSPFKRTSQFKIYMQKLNRAGYYRMLSFGGTATYTVQTSPVSRHTFTPLRLTFNVLQGTTEKFDSIRNANQALYISMQNQFIPAMSYTYTYDDTPFKRKRHHTWWETSVTSSGNVTSGIYAIFGNRFNEKDKMLLGNPFAQFLKVTSELRRTFSLGDKLSLATRVFGGVIYAYGNSSVAPYSEQFYIGGANSIRAFTVRSIGPGRYQPQTGMYSYIDQTGDIKLEANVELRFPIFGDLYGATFLDAGNIWLLREDAQRPGAKFSLKDFGKQIALGTGVGFRYDLEFLVLRLDVGIGLHAPYETSRKGYYNIPKFWDGLGWHFAIGYPF
ncbi:BamA/TamA family outer membrane protein [Bacteroides sp. Marseille-P3684]|uniref:translocation and assembly module lipoprotein TamL n=1 Tax=Bacteroides sp. Marseille-P3684 TaxID=2086579 RepID=UPI0018FEFE6C|nr:BamA/TamA family outer membrane protein [Bacteroides sp. Marseille-P3684]